MSRPGILPAITPSARQALAVPVAALVTTPGGHPAIDLVGTAGTTRLVPVTLGIFDDGKGEVQISGPGVTAGETITLPAEQDTIALVGLWGGEGRGVGGRGYPAE